MGCCRAYRFERSELVLIPNNLDLKKSLESEFDDISLSSHEDTCQVFDQNTKQSNPGHIRSLSGISTKSFGSSLYRNEFELAFLVSPTSIRCSLNDSIINTSVENTKKSY